MTKKKNTDNLTWEERTNNAAALAIAGELEAAVSYAGAELTGFSMRLSEEETLMTLRVVLAGRRQVAFVASGTMAQCLAKAVRDAKSDKLRWKADKFAARGG